MTKLILQKPRVLTPGDRVAIVTPSWGGPATVPHRYQMGLRELRDRFGFEVAEMPHTRAEANWIWRNPKARADDVNAAFADPSIKGIIAAIGGDDSVRILPYLDEGIISANPKVFMGYSDTTTLHVFAMLCGVQTFYGPSLLSGIAESGGTFPYAESWMRRTLMSDAPVGQLEPALEWTDERESWEDVDSSTQRRAMRPNPGWKWLQGTQRVEGHLVGGCLDVLEFLKGTRWWPDPEIWEGAVFYWETSEDAPIPEQVGYWLRSYGMLGILDRIVGMMIGRPGSYSSDQHRALPETIRRIVDVEFGRSDMPIVMNLDFGHTDPQMVIPNGARVILDPVIGAITLPDSACNA